MVEGAPTPSKKRIVFDLSACAKKRPPPAPEVIPRATDMKIGAQVSWTLPSERLLADLGGPTTVIGFDIDSTCLEGVSLSELTEGATVENTVRFLYAIAWKLMTGRQTLVRKVG